MFNSFCFLISSSAPPFLFQSGFCSTQPFGPNQPTFCSTFSKSGFSKSGFSKSGFSKSGFFSLCSSSPSKQTSIFLVVLKQTSGVRRTKQTFGRESSRRSRWTTK